MVLNTRRRHRKTSVLRQRGGFYTEMDRLRIQEKFVASASETQTQIIHCISQMKRFSTCFVSHPVRSYQFFYNLGRLQELLRETKYPILWWTPLEVLVKAGDYTAIEAHVIRLKELIGMDTYDVSITKGCE